MNNVVSLPKRIKGFTEVLGTERDAYIDKHISYILREDVKTVSNIIGREATAILLYEMIDKLRNGSIKGK